jgi:hypothetical protein
MDYSETILAAEPDTRANRGDRNMPKPRRSGLISKVLPTILAIGVIGGGLYALWMNKDALLDSVLGDGEKPTIQASENGASETAEVKTDVANNGDADSSQSESRAVRIVGDEITPKNSTKLTTTGDTVQVDPIPPLGETSENTEQNNPDLKTGTGDSAQQVVVIGEDGQPSNTVDDSGNATQLSGLAPAGAQKAFLYEEGITGSSASRDNAAIIWSLGREVIVGGASEAVIKGQLDVPGRNLSMNLLIKRNHDESLPASHIIELLFQLPKDFSGGNVSEVSRFVMKTSEQGRGEGLIAVPAKISDGNFLIALNNLDQALATNNKLLLESSWIDVPLGYTTGRRALVTLEKGEQGRKVFREAFADWDKR